MEELKNKLEQPSPNPPAVKDQTALSSIIERKSADATDVKSVIDLSATKSALERSGTVEKLVDEKTKELTADAEAKKIVAETSRIREEVQKVRQQSEKEIAELDSKKKRLEQEISEIRQKTDKAQAYFDANKEILRVVGIKNPLTLKSMQFWIYPASIIYALFQFLLLPLTLLGFCLESLIEIVGTVTDKFAKSGWKMAITVATVIVIVALIILAYWLLINFAYKVV